MLETNWIELNVAADGTVTWRESANVYQFSNETVGVRIYAPFDPHSESALINIRLPDDTVLQEKPMTHVVDGDEEEGIHKWQYAFDGLATALTGYDYAASIVLSFRFVDISKSPSQTTNQVSVPIQPSLQGDAMYVTPETADELNAKLDEYSAQFEEVSKTASSANENAETAKSIADSVKADLDQAVEDSANAFRISNESNAKSDEAVSKINDAVDVANKVREDFDEIIEKELSIVQEKGQGTAVAMSQKAVTDALLETVEVSELSGEILTIPNTEDGALEDYRILGKSVQDGTPAPDNPIEIQSVESPVNVVSCGTNLLPPLNFTYTGKGVTFTGNNGAVSVKGTKTEEGDIYVKSMCTIPFSIKSGTYTIGIDLNYGGSAGNWAFDFQDNAGQSVLKFDKATVLKKATFTIDNEQANSISQLSFSIYVAGSSAGIGAVFDTTTYPTISIGTAVLPYEPYCGATTEITVTGTDGTVYPLRGIGDVHDEVDFDRNVLIQRVGEYTWSGTEYVGKHANYDSDLTTSFFSSHLEMYQNCKKNLTTNEERSVVLFSHFPIDLSIFGAKDAQGALITSNTTFRINKSIANDVDSFKSWLAENPVTVVYPLEEPVEIPLQTLPAIPTMDGTTTIITTNTPAPELYCTEYMDAQMGNPVTLKSLNEVINPVTSAELVYNRNTKNTVARDITELQMKNTDQDKQIDTLNEKLYSTDPTKVIPVKKAETANVVPLKYLLDTIYPVGSIYISTVDNSPMNFLGGTWERITGDAYLKIVSSGAGSKAGSNTHNHNPGLLRANVSSTTDGIDIYEITNDAYSWNANYRVSGTTSSVSVSHASVVPIVGTTADATINPYYYGVYVWKRTA